MSNDFLHWIKQLAKIDFAFRGLSYRQKAKNIVFIIEYKIIMRLVFRWTQRRSRSLFYGLYCCPDCCLFVSLLTYQTYRSTKALFIYNSRIKGFCFNAFNHIILMQKLFREQRIFVMTYSYCHSKHLWVYSIFAYLSIVSTALTTFSTPLTDTKLFI